MINLADVMQQCRPPRFWFHFNWCSLQIQHLESLPSRHVYQLQYQCLLLNRAGKRHGMNDSRSAVKLASLQANVVHVSLYPLQTKAHPTWRSALGQQIWPAFSVSGRLVPSWLLPSIRSVQPSPSPSFPPSIPVWVRLSWCWTLPSQSQLLQLSISLGGWWNHLYVYSISPWSPPETLHAGKWQYCLKSEL